MVLNLYVALANALLFGVVGTAGASLAWPTTLPGWSGLVGATLAFLLGFLGLFVGVTMIGPRRAACLTNVEPVVTIALSATMLRESFGLWQLIGMGAVLAGIFVMCRNVVPARDLEEREQGARVAGRNACPEPSG